MFEPTGTLDDLVPSVRAAFEGLVTAAAALGMQPRVASVGRTCADQAAISAQPGATHAALCRSWHVLGRAVDLDLSPNDCATYTKLGELWEARGGTWGGRFPGFGDCGDRRHFQMAATGAVPLSVCPDALSVEECEAIRQRVLGTEASSSSLAFFLSAIAVGAVAGLALWVRR